MTFENQECNCRYFQTCNENKEGHLCYMTPLKNGLPAGDKLLYVLHEFETTQNAINSDVVTLHVPNLACLQYFFRGARGKTSAATACKAARGSTRSAMIL